MDGEEAFTEWLNGITERDAQEEADLEEMIFSSG